MLNKKRKWGVIGSYMLCVLALTVVLNGCDGFLQVGNKFLEKAPGADVTKDTVFSNATYANELLVHAYESLHDGLGGQGAYYTGLLGDQSTLQAITDIGQDYNSNNGGPSVYYYPGSYSADVEEDDKYRTKFQYKDGATWAGMRDAFIFLENIDQVPDMDEQMKEQRKGEAIMNIAARYVRMFRNYGGMIWIDHAYGPNEDFQLPRLTAKATLDSTVALIDRAIPKLPFVLNNPAADLGRFTQAGAMGLKCRVLLFGASPLFNSNQPYMSGEAASKKLVWYGGYDPGLWQRAADACGALIDKVESTGAYHLADEKGTPRKNFRHGYYDRDSPEILMQTRKGYTGEGGGNGLPNSLVNEGVGAITDNYVKMFPMEDGTPIDEPGSGYDPAHPYENRDPRLYETVLLNGEPWQGRSAETWIGGKERKTKFYIRTRSGYQVFKFALDLEESQNHPRQWPYVRLPEIYLSYAEALNEVNNGPTAEAYKYVNKVRNRVGLKNLQEIMDDPNSKEEFREKVIRERVLEFGREEVRWYDLIRWKMKDAFTKTLYGMNICKKGETPAGTCQDNGVGYTESNDYIYARFKLDDRYWKNNFSPKWYLSAFPRGEINKRYGLIQNPGW